MTEKKARIIRLVYNIIFCILAATVAVLLIYEVCDIYFGSGVGTGNFTRAIVTQRLKNISPAIWLLIAAIIIGLVLYEVLPPQGKKKYGQDVRYSLYRLKKKLPVKAEGDLLKDAAVVARYQLILRIVWGVVAVICTIFAAVGIAYMLDKSHFAGDDATEDIVAALIKISPYVICSFALCIGAVIYEGWGAKKQLPHIKRLAALGKKDDPSYNKLQRAYYTAVAAASKELTLWIVRGVLFVVAVLFIILGIFNDGAGDVLLKAVNICTECIGLG